MSSAVSLLIKANNEKIRLEASLYALQQKKAGTKEREARIAVAAEIEEITIKLEEVASRIDLLRSEALAQPDPQELNPKNDSLFTRQVKKLVDMLQTPSGVAKLVAFIAISGLALYASKKAIEMVQSYWNGTPLITSSTEAATIALPAGVALPETVEINTAVDATVPAATVPAATVPVSVLVAAAAAGETAPINWTEAARYVYDHSERICAALSKKGERLEDLKNNGIINDWAYEYLKLIWNAKDGKREKVLQYLSEKFLTAKIGHSFNWMLSHNHIIGL